MIQSAANTLRVLSVACPGSANLPIGGFRRESNNPPFRSVGMIPLFVRSLSACRMFGPGLTFLHRRIAFGESDGPGGSSFEWAGVFQLQRGAYELATDCQFLSHVLCDSVGNVLDGG